MTWEVNAAIYLAVIVRMRFDQPTIDHVARRTTEGLAERDIELTRAIHTLTTEIHHHVTGDATERE